MRRLLLSSVVVVAAILAPTAATYGPTVIENTSSQTVPSTGISDLPVLRNDNILVPPPASVSVHPGVNTSSLQPAAPAAVHAAPAAAPGGGSTSVTQGSTTTPEPATCTGTSMSKSSSENGQRTRTHHSRSDCGDNCDEDPCNN